MISVVIYYENFVLLDKKWSRHGRKRIQRNVSHLPGMPSMNQTSKPSSYIFKNLVCLIVCFQFLLSGLVRISSYLKLI